MRHSEDRRRVLQVAKRYWTIVVLAGLLYYLWRNGHQLLATLSSIPVAHQLGALGCIVIGKFSALHLMRASLQLQSSQLSGWRDNAWVYASSDVAKYMPGGIWAIVGRVVHYRNSGMSAVAISKALFFEHVIFGITALALALPVGVIVLADLGWMTPFPTGLTVMLAGLGVVIAGRLSRRLNLPIPGRKAARIILAAVVVMLCGWIAMGTSFFLLFPQYDTLTHWLWSIGSYATAFVTGMAAVFAPAGAGVREGVLVLAGRFSGLPAAMMLDAAILSRAVWVIADLCVFTLALLVRPSTK